ncbi:hypothetical protein CWB96_01845 [Pseudoalteromonas citrea]|uniref:Uncharacterized protein n=1 Tax=Pseudoalteromonas citrea TaxID=43655 RepID=A0A5S3XUB7_9GAMM|nr:MULTISPECIES: hypothetical protein [Pseudoalteromonas]RJE78162.1 hypothetical protein BGP78_06540 [Pseudoalteromonas sp. MSK9-3]TMP46383.1 hypothetical protein CWB97_01880 [Pseudoalteromonas citrea]TMP62318.1 hypothetical protein CWB96_01845 [Pseudoalteromonas citrea]
MALEQDIAKLIEASNDLTTIVDNKIQDIDSKVLSAKSTVDGYISQVNSYIDSARGKQSHFRLTKNQALIPNADSTFPLHWSGGFVKSAKVVETVTTGVEVDQRSALAREFLQAISSDAKYFAGSFKIWELEYYPNRRGDNINTSAYLMYQYLRRPTVITAGAVVKHIKGVVPTGHWCSGLEANQPAKICGQLIGHSGRNHYTHCHPYVNGAGKPETETGIIQVALPAVVTGDVDLTKKQWGQFAYLGDADQPAYN